MADIANDALLRLADLQVGKANALDGAKPAFGCGTIAGIKEKSDGRGAQHDREQGAHAMNRPLQERTAFDGRFSVFHGDYLTGEDNAVNQFDSESAQSDMRIYIAFKLKPLFN